MKGDVLLDGGRGNDVINATVNVASPIRDGTHSTDVIGGSGNDTCLTDGRGAICDNILTNTVDGASSDGVPAHAESEFNGYHATITNLLFGGATTS